MKIKIIVFTLLLITGPAIFAGDDFITFPSAETLTTRFTGLNLGLDLDLFIEKTDLVSKLADQERPSMGVATEITFALYAYLELQRANPELYKATMPQILAVKPKIIESVLQDFPKEIESLKADGLLK